MVQKVTRSVLHQMRVHAGDAHPRECCGILLGGGDVITGASAVRNIHPSPETHFEIDPQALVDAFRKERSGGPKVVGYYHSHPHGPAEPSAVDAEQASGDGRVWAIIANNKITWWRDAPDGFTPLSLALTHG